MNKTLTRLKYLITTLTLSGMIFLPLGVFTTIAHAQAPNDISGLCSGASLSVSGGNCQDTSDSLNNIIRFVLNLFSIIVGVTAVIMIIVGGFKYIISGGDSSRVTGAKDTILFAIVGLVIVALAQVIVHFVLYNVNNTFSGGGGTGS